MSILSLLKQTVVIYAKSGYNREGRETLSATGTSVSARFERKEKRRLLPNGSMVTIFATMIVGPSTTIDTDYKVTYDSENYKVYSVSKVPDGSGNIHHIEVELIKWLST